MGYDTSKSGADIGKGGVCGQILLFIINCVFIGLGAISLAIGAWAIATGSNFSFLTGSQVIGGAAILIIAGGVTIIIAAIGILGVLCKSRILLCIYALVVLIVVILEIVAGILGFIYRDRVLNLVQNQISEDLISKYNLTNPNDATILVNGFQNFFQCCGANNATDWTRLNPQVIHENGDQPPGCPPCYTTNCADYFYEFFVDGGIKTEVFNATTIGCLSVDTQPLLGLALGAGVVGIIFGLLEITGIVIALILCCCIHKARQQEVV